MPWPNLDVDRGSHRLEHHCVTAPVSVSIQKNAVWQAREPNGNALIDVVEASTDCLPAFRCLKPERKALKFANS